MRYGTLMKNTSIFHEDLKCVWSEYTIKVIQQTSLCSKRGQIWPMTQQMNIL